MPSINGLGQSTREHCSLTMVPARLLADSGLVPADPGLDTSDAGIETILYKPRDHRNDETMDGGVRGSFGWRFTALDAAYAYYQSDSSRAV
jgi:hypothetical protein